MAEGLKTVFQGRETPLRSHVEYYTQPGLECLDIKIWE